MDEIIQFLKSAQGLVTSLTALIAGVVALLAALKKLSIFRITGSSKTNPSDKGTPNRTSVVFATALISTATTGLFTGLFFHDYVWARYPLQLSGSTNVYAYLQENFPASLSEDVSVTDQGSSEALKQVFSMFDYGKRVGDPRRTGWLAMSSNGNRGLREVISNNKSNPSFLENNYWLSVTIAHRPLMIIYRKIPSGKLKIERASWFPPELRNGILKPSSAYNFVRASELKRFLLMDFPTNTRLYLPEKGTGTRANFDADQRQAFAWPSAEQLPTYIEAFDGDFPMLAIVSEVPAKKTESHNSTRCERLDERALSIALICTDHDICDGFPSAEFTVVGKVGQDLSLSGSHFKLMNEGECRFMRSLNHHIDSKCGVTGSADDFHILEADSSFGQSTAPDITSCAK
ncbi:hypothetical protein [Paraburkholderia phytofirmans]|uniref:hypothetical protein n=1 Tax=Paraburkholderia phytofirmans TaxID=261302 RepID=UPI0038BC2CD1